MPLPVNQSKLRNCNIPLLVFYDYFAECKIGVTLAREFTRSVLRSFSHSVLPSLGHTLLFVIPLTNAYLNLTTKLPKMSSNVKRSEAMCDEIITALSRTCGASIFLFELFKYNLEPRKHLLPLLRNEHGLPAGINNMKHAMHGY